MTLHLPAASTFAPEIDALMATLCGVSVLILLVVFGLAAYYCVRYRHGSQAPRKTPSRGNALVEWSWASATLVIFVALYGWGAWAYFRMHVAPESAEAITVVGKQWMWKFQHENGRQELAELHVPLGKPVTLTMISQDVIHSLFIPAFRLKQDVLPGRYTHAWFEATATGVYDLFCSQFCGGEHSIMRARVFVLTPTEYAQWLATGLPHSTRLSPEPLGSRAERGHALFDQMACARCHAPPPDSARVAPPLEGLYQSTVRLTDGTTLTADDDYLRESIVSPSLKIVAGYQNIMPPYQGRVSEEELFDLIAYLRELR